MLGIIFKEQEREKFEAANGNKGSSKKGECRKCLVSDSWPGMESLGEPVAVSGIIMRCLTLPRIGLSLQAGENREWGMGMQNGQQSWGETATRGRILHESWKNGLEERQEPRWHRAFYNHDTDRAPGTLKDTTDPLGSKNSQVVTHEHLILLSLVFFAFRIYFYSSLNCSKEYLVFTHSFTPTPRNILPLTFYFGVFQ